MLFNSLQFLIFLPIVFLLYWFVFSRRRRQTALVVAASYYFYGCWDWRFLFLIFLTTLTSFVSGWIIGRYDDSRRVRRWACGVNIVLNFLILGWFKYFNFFIDNLNIIFEQLGYQLDWVTIEILLPVGISFYTFQAVSYPIDVYRRKISATDDFVAFAAFVSFFPQLVAGPIERSTNLLPQFLRDRKFDYASAVSGMRQMLWGFFKKLVVADNCAYIANLVFADINHSNSGLLIVGALCFTFQIYCDFSGYSDIAIGSARLFGIDLKANFCYPYLSRNPGEFWRRWHISLNRWFIDYVYIPLGGSRCSKAKVIRNTMIVFALSGLWHGAAWTFVAWGVYNGILLVLPIMIKGRGYQRFAGVAAQNSWLPSLKECAGIVITFILAVAGWIIFRADDMGQCAQYFAGIFTHSIGSMPNYAELGIGSMIWAYTLGFIALLYAVEYVQRRKPFALDLSDVKGRLPRLTIYTVVFLLILIFSGTREKFIYFQF